MERKLEKMCPNFAALDELYGHRQNIVPASVFSMSTSDDDDLWPAIVVEIDDDEVQGIRPHSNV